jgi:hypothetical protein
MDIHSYAFYKGEVSYIGGPISNDGIASCIFNNEKVFCYIHEVKDFEGSFYYSKCRYGKLIIPINLKIKDQIEIGEISIPRPEIHGGRGKYGCIPKFIKNEDGDLAYNENNGKKVITLHIARHYMINDINQTILELEPHPFPISDEDYSRLNDWFKKDNNIQGGVDDSSLQSLNVISGTGSELGVMAT